MLPARTKFLIVGAGLHGLSTAYHLGKELEAGFTIVPGIGKVPAGKRVSVGGHPALHWTIKLSAKAIVGLQYSVTESIYLVPNDREAVMIEFVTMGRPINEKALLGTFRFN